MNPVAPSLEIFHHHSRALGNFGKILGGYFKNIWDLILDILQYTASIHLH